MGYRSKLDYFLKKNSVKFDSILVVDIPYPALSFVKQYAKQNNINLLHDSVEWYSPEQFKQGKFSIQYILKNLYNKRWIDKNFNIIAISSYLKNHFRQKGCKTIHIPAILDIQNMLYKKRTVREKLTLVYAGSPGKKDYIKEAIEGIALLDKNIIDKIDFRVIGITEAQLISMCDISQQAINKLSYSLNALGRIPRDDVLKHLEEADFTVLMRSPIQRYAKAGFPTKVVESLASGTPIICNITSDLGDYIHDSENGIIVEECTAEAFSNAIRKALSLTIEQRNMMYIKARKSAEECFDYRLYEDALKELLSSGELIQKNS